MTTGTTARSLVVAPQWIGDAVMSQPLLARLAQRAERITVGALPWVAPVYRAMPEVADVIELPFAHGRFDGLARWRIAADLRGRFDAAYVLPNSIKSALIPWLAGIPRRIGYSGEGRPWLLNRRLHNPPGRPPMTAYYSALAAADAMAARRWFAAFAESKAAAAAAASVRRGGAVDRHAAAPVDQPPRLRLPAESLHAACVRAGVEPQRFWVLAPGAEYGPAKRWPAEHYAALAGMLIASERLPVLLLGSAGERGLCAAIAAAAPDRCRALAGETALVEAMALIAMARGVVSNDSGLMHVAAAFGVPQVAVFGSTSPLHTPPLNRRARVIWLQRELKQRLNLDCVPCFERECRYGHTGCLAEVSPSDVLAALLATVDETLPGDLPQTATAAPTPQSPWPVDQGASLPT